MKQPNCNRRICSVALAALVVVAVLGGALLPRDAAAAGLPGNAISAQRMTTIPQDVQVLVIDARQWYFEAQLAIEQCNQAKFAAAMDAMMRDRTRLHDIEVAATDLRDQMRQNQINILKGLAGLIPDFDLLPDAAGNFGSQAVGTAVKAAAETLAEGAEASLAGADIVGEVINKFKELEEKQKLDAEKQEILRQAEYQAAQIGLVNLTIDGARDAQKELDDEMAQLNALWADRKCGERTATGYGGTVTDGGTSTTGGVTVTPGADVAKNHVTITDQTTQHDIPGGHIVVIPDDPKQPVRTTEITGGGTTEIPQHGPNDIVEIVGTCHQKVDLKGSDFNGPTGVAISTPSKPVKLTFVGLTADQVTEKMVNEALQGQYHVSLGKGQPPYTVTEENKSFPVTFVTVSSFQANTPSSSPTPQQCPTPTTTTGGGGGHTTTDGGGGGVCTGGDCTMTDGGSCTGDDCTPCTDGGCTVTDGGHIAEGDIPQEIQGPPPNDPLARSKGSWGQSYDDQWWLRAINWLKADGTTVLPDTGKPVIVAVIDTGVDLTHPDLMGAAWINPTRLAAKPNKSTAGKPDPSGYQHDVFGWNFIDNNADVSDHNGHGTVIAGIIAAMSNKGFGMAGIDPWAKIMALKAMEIDGQGGSVNVSKAIYYAVDHGARVINLSVGGKRLSIAEQAALNYAAKKNVLVVVASGNEGVDTANWAPAGLRHALTVAALDPDLKRPTFSNWGANVALAAPGVDILSLRARQTDLLIFARKDYKPGTAIVKGAYYRVTGSSFAAPMVSGAAALLLSERPELTAVQVTRILEQTARNISGIGTDQFTGYGLIDIDAALKADPNAFVDAAIAGVGVAQANGHTVVRVSGTANADRLKEAYIEIGAGDAPTSWQRVSRTIGAPVVGGVLDDLDPSVFAGSKVWTLRVIAVNQNGRQREARYKLSLG